ncbi:MAG: 50S ribosomal protein L6 [Dethiobacteria bacterium]|jgi:large subunit ribosomal protein L6|nr:50S ribosomal protein L6 [Bacillota bacterium]NMD34069.1 50S ribosomal protein L6 [Bacillota bacterium]
MSRIGKKPIAVPDKVQVEVVNNWITVKGPRGQLSKEIPRPILVEQQEGQLLVKRPSDSEEHRALHGLTRTLIQNMITGVTEGFTRSLELVGVGYRANLQGKKLVLNVGLSYPVIFEPEENMEIEVPSPNKIIVKGIDKQQVGNFAAVVRKVHPPEPYKGKGIRYVGEQVRRKVGKAGT